MKKVLLPLISVIILGLLFYKGLKVRWANLFSPGALSSVHAELDKTGKCDACHTKGKQLETAKCLDCHKEIKEKRQAGSGLHGREKDACFACHSEHHGREADIAFFNKDAFDHSKAGWALEGMHKKLRCEACHQEKSYLMAGTECFDCHHEQDVHWGENGKDCAECHNQDTFKLE
jgi:hypothetical protein